MIKLLHNLVAIKVNVAEQTTSSGLYISKPEKQYSGNVVAVGPGFYTQKGELVETTIKVGDEVVFNKNSNGEIITVDGEQLLVLSEQHIIGILKESNI